MKHLPIQKLEDLGFKINYSYEHDEWITRLHEKGNIAIETTCKKSGEIESQEMYIANTDVNFGVEDLLHLDRILNKTT